MYEQIGVTFEVCTLSHVGSLFLYWRGRDAYRVQFAYLFPAL